MFRPLSLAAALLALPLSALACDGFEARDAYARASTAMSQSAAAFMILHNHGTTDCHVTGVRSGIAARTELHTHIEDENGVMRMVEIEQGFPLPVDGGRVLERGGDHVMFLGLNRPLAQGDTVQITLVFADGSEAELDVVVDNARQPASHGHSQGHSHGN